MSKAVAHVEILGSRVRVDADGRYSLNDLHRSAIANGKASESQRPGNCLKSAPIVEFVGALETAPQIAVCVSVAVRSGGTFADELVAIRYAAWIDPTFEVHVYRTFQQAKRDAASRVAEEMERAASRARARLEAPALTDAVKYSRLSAGKELAPYHFSNEFDLINRVVLGGSSKQYRAEHGLASNDLIRDTLTPCQIKAVEHMQRLNASLIDVGMPYEQRKAKLHQVFLLRHQRALIAETLRLEA